MSESLNSSHGATAICQTTNGTYIIAVNQLGIYRQKNNIWELVLHLDLRIREFAVHGSSIYGIGECGVFIKSTNDGLDWTCEFLPTKETIWSITINEDGLIATHGQNQLFLSNDSGETWKTILPFHSLDSRPAIRSLYFYEYILFIGTKIHSRNGGVWMLNLKSMKIRKIKSELNRMIASMVITDEVLITASGSCKGLKGMIEACSLKDFQWYLFDTPLTEDCYLDLAEYNGTVYTSSTQNKNGYSTVSKVCIQNKVVKPCDEIQGHGWRVWTSKSQYAVAGLYEIKHSHQRSFFHLV